MSAPEKGRFSLDKNDPNEQNGQALKAVLDSLEWYIDQSKRLFVFNLLFLIFFILSLFFNFYQFFYQVKPTYFATTSNHRILQLPPVNEPILSDETVAKWAEKAAVQALAINYTHFRDDLMKARVIFDPAGFIDYTSALIRSGNLKKIQDERINLNWIPKGQPQILGSALLKGRYSWRVEAPGLLRYETSAGIVSSMPLTAQMIIQRVSPIYNPRGVVIKQLVLSNRTPDAGE